MADLASGDSDTYRLLDSEKWQGLVENHLSYLRSRVGDGVKPTPEPIEGWDFRQLSAGELAFTHLNYVEINNSVLDGLLFHTVNFDCAYLGAVQANSTLFEECLLTGTRFSNCSFKNARFGHSNLRYASFRKCDLSGANLSECDLRGTVFTGSLLDMARLPTDVPLVENIDARILEALEQPGNELDMDDWHTCETIHCRAGWAIHLAGKAGYALASKVGTNTAGALIYAKSAPTFPIPDWYQSKEGALRSMRYQADVSN